jgi:hypothetical protein
MVFLERNEKLPRNLNGTPRSSSPTQTVSSVTALLCLDNCPPKVHMLKSWFLACGTIRGSKPFKRWDLVERS